MNKKRLYFRELKDECEGKKKSKFYELSFFNLKWNLLFDIYDIISKISYSSLIRVFLNYIKVQFKEGNYLIDGIDIVNNIQLIQNFTCVLRA